MDRRSLAALAVILIVLMVIVATAGLDNLPRYLRDSVNATVARLPADRATFEQNRAFIEESIRDEPVLFQTKASAWHDRLERDRSKMETSAADLAILQQLAKANHRTDSSKVAQRLSEFDSLRAGAVRDASEVHDEAQRWLSYKQELPKRLESMHASYEAVNNFDVDSATPQVLKAKNDWPDKRADLESRVDALKKSQQEGRDLWEASAKLRSAAEANPLTGDDYATLFSEADRLDAVAHQLPEGAAPLNALAGQLYTSWDKILADLDNDHGYREKVRIVRVASGQTTTEEQWKSIDRAGFREAQARVGMTIEHKPTGRFDSEAERVVQPPAYAYLAPPGQSNAYGGWTAGVWHWLPEYLILSQLLHASRGPIVAGDYGAWQNARSRGEIFYGRNNEYYSRWGRVGGGLGPAFNRAAPRSTSPASPPSTGWYKERPKPSFGDHTFGGSQYQNRGAFNGSRYQSRGSFGARSFGRGMARGGRR